MKKLFAVIAAALALTACGGGGDDDKELFSLWTNTSTGHALDLRGAAFNTPMYPSFFLADGTNCLCEGTIIGDHGNGSFALSRCISSPYNSAVNAQCQALNGTGTYSNSGSLLTLNFAGGSATYE